MFEPKREDGWIKKRDGNYYQMGSQSLYHYPDTMEFKSYYTTMAVFHKGLNRWLVTNDWHTMTTKKHLNEIRSCLKNYISIPDSRVTIERNIEYIKEKIKDLNDKYERARIAKPFYSSQIQKQEMILNILEAHLAGKVSIYEYVGAI